MTRLDRRSFSMAPARRCVAALRAFRAGARRRRSQAGRHRRRAGRRDGRAIRRQGLGRRGRGHAGRAAEELHHLLPLEPLSRRLRDFEVDHPHLRQAGVELRRQARPRGRSRRSTATRRRCASPTAATLPYDRLVVAPGIDLKFDSVPGYSEAAAEEHAARLEAGRADAAPEEAARCARRTAAPSS